MAACNGALQVVSPKGNDFEVVESTLKQILLDSRVADTKVMIVSIVGGRGKGRSFLLNVFLRYLQNHDRDDWMDVTNDPLNGFKWGISDEANTTGLLLWPEPFIIKVPPTNEEVCILLMDSQGYPGDIMNSEYLKIFALSSKISSVQIYTITQMDTRDLLYLKAALRGCEGNQFQRFYFLLQNWKYQALYENGLEGGKRYLEEHLEIDGYCSHEFKETSKYITEKLKDRHCFILPNPGQHVMSYNFKGHLSDNGIAVGFKTSLKAFAELVLGPEKVVVKEIDGRRVTGRLLFEYFKTYTEESNRVRHSRNLFQSPGKDDNERAVGESLTVYREEMDKVCGVGLQLKPYLSQKYFEYHHHLSLEMAVQKLRDVRNSKKLFGEDWFYEKKLRQEVMELHDGYEKSNLEKNGMRPALIFLIYFGICASLFLLGYFFSHDGYLSTITKAIVFMMLIYFRLQIDRSEDQTVTMLYLTTMEYLNHGLLKDLMRFANHLKKKDLKWLI